MMGVGRALPFRAVDLLPREELGAETGVRAGEGGWPSPHPQRHGLDWISSTESLPQPHSPCARVTGPRDTQVKLVLSLERGRERACGGAGQGGESHGLTAPGNPVGGPHLRPMLLLALWRLRLHPGRLTVFSPDSGVMT